MIDMDIFEMQTALAYDMAICRFLENQQADDQIRLVALKYIRQVLTQEQASKIPLSYVRSLVAVGNDVQDAFRRACVETLRSLALVNVEAVAKCNGLETFIRAILDPKLSSV